MQHSAPTRRHREIMVRFEAVLEANPDRVLSMLEVCASIGVPGRTLRACCAELLGTSPKHYLYLRRMHLARQALIRAIPDTITVTKVATGYGFWELGRFAVAYRSLYGESPSVTLRRELVGGSRRDNSPRPVPFAKFA